MNRSLREIDCSYFEDLFDQNEDINIITLLKNNNFRVEQTKCRSLRFIQNRLARKKYSYIAILREQIWQANVNHLENPEDYFRLVGFAYTTNKLKKIKVKGKNNPEWIYVINGEP